MPLHLVKILHIALNFLLFFRLELFDVEIWVVFVLWRRLRLWLALGVSSGLTDVHRGCGCRLKKSGISRRCLSLVDCKCIDHISVFNVGKSLDLFNMSFLISDHFLNCHYFSSRRRNNSLIGCWTRGCFGLRLINSLLEIDKDFVPGHLGDIFIVSLVFLIDGEIIILSFFHQNFLASEHGRVVDLLAKADSAIILVLYGFSIDSGKGSHHFMDTSGLLGLAVGHPLLVEVCVCNDLVTSANKHGSLHFEKLRHNPWLLFELHKSPFEQDLMCIRGLLIIILVILENDFEKETQNLTGVLAIWKQE